MRFGPSGRPSQGQKGIARGELGYSACSRTETCLSRSAPNFGKILSRKENSYERSNIVNENGESFSHPIAHISEIEPMTTFQNTFLSEIVSGGEVPLSGRPIPIGQRAYFQERLKG